MAKTARMMEPQLLTAAALAYTVMCRMSTTPQAQYNPTTTTRRGNRKQQHHEDSSLPELDFNDYEQDDRNNDDNDSIDDGIPNIEGDDNEEDMIEPVPELPPTIASSKTLHTSCRIKPVTVVPQVPPAVAVHAQKKTPTTTITATVSASTMRLVQSRQRARDAMEHHAAQNKTRKASTVSTPKVETKEHQYSPTTKQPFVKTSFTPPASIATKAPELKETPSTSVDTSTSSITAEQPQHMLRFKVQSKSTSVTVRFQCRPSYREVSEQISQRLDNNKTTTKLIIFFQDADEDWCVLSDQDDLKDAIAAAASRKDNLIRLQVKEEQHSMTTMFWNTLSTGINAGMDGLNAGVDVGMEGINAGMDGFWRWRATP